jgi:predicted transcriptional regulator
MRVLWDRGRATSRDVYDELHRRRRIAYSTVTATLGNLARKGLVAQERRGAAFVYTPAVSDVDVATTLLDTLVAAIMGGRAAPLIDHLETRSAPGARAAGGAAAGER